MRNNICKTCSEKKVAHSQVGVPAIQKPVTAELGCVTPYIVIPGKWTRQAIDYYADECAAGLISNSGHNCTKLELLITAKDWPQREQFMAAVRYNPSF